MVNHRMAFVFLAALGLFGFLNPASAAEKKVKVFILAGQSNMEGHGQVSSLPHLGNHPKYGHLLKKLKGPGGKWAVRDDVTISYKAPQRKKRSGPLTVGWGGQKHELGPELMFGTIMGDKYDSHVLLIKTAWGGKDVSCDFRSPSAGKPAGAEAKYFAHKRKEGDTRKVGEYYRKMVAEVKEALANIKDTDENHLPTKELNDEFLRLGQHWFCHYNGSAANYCLIGWGLAESLIDSKLPKTTRLFRN